jgi:hypothetical protein
MRTVARHLAALRAAGYVRTTQTIDERGATTGLRIALSDGLLPYWEIESDEGPVTNGTSNRDSPDGHRRRDRRCRSETRRSTGRVPEAAILTVWSDWRRFHASRQPVAASSAGL